MSLCLFPVVIGVPSVTSPPGAWQATHVYAPGDKVINGTSPARIYVCTAGGTSAGAGGPSGAGTGIVDNTVTWDYVADVPGIPSAPTLTLPTPACLLDLV